MPHFAIVIDDPEKHHAAALERHMRANVPEAVERMRRNSQGRRALDAVMDEARVTNAVARRVREIVGEPAPVGELHTIAESECPDGLPNCRNCGDPAHAETCRAAGHCPHCGTRHGIAPDSYLAYSGVSLQEVVVPAELDAAATELAGLRAAPDTADTHARRERTLRTLLELYVWDRHTRSFVPKG